MPTPVFLYSIVCVFDYIFFGGGRIWEIIYDDKYFLDQSSP